MSETQSPQLFLGREDPVGLGFFSLHMFTIEFCAQALGLPEIQKSGLFTLVITIPIGSHTT